MKKVLLTATVQSHIAQFHKPLIKMLKEQGYIVHVAARNNLTEKNGLSIEDVDKIYDLNFSRSPLSSNNFKVYKQLKKIIQENDYEIVHCNTPVGGVLTRLAARKYRKNGLKVIYTAHGFHFYKGASIKNWIIFYTIEKWLSKYTDILITVVEEDYNLAIKKKFKCNVKHIHSVGANSKRFFIDDSIKNLKNSNKDEFNCLCIGELNKNKNQITILKAMNIVLKKYPNIKLSIAGNGKQKEKLEKYIIQNALENNVKLLGYRTDIENIIRDSNLLISASKREGLGMNLIEALMCGVPVIASKNRGHNEIVKESINGYLFDYEDYEKIAELIIKVFSLRETKFVDKSKLSETVKKYFDIKVIQELKDIYFG